MRPENAAERAFEARAKESLGSLLGDASRVEEGPFQGELGASGFPRLNFYASGPATDLPGSQRVIIIGDVRVWRQGNHDGSRVQLREIDAALADSLEGARVGISGFSVHVLSVGSFQPIPGSHPNIRGRRRVFTFQVIADASTS